MHYASLAYRNWTTGVDVEAFNLPCTLIVYATTDIVISSIRIIID